MAEAPPSERLSAKVSHTISITPYGDDKPTPIAEDEEEDDFPVRPPMDSTGALSPTSPGGDLSMPMGGIRSSRMGKDLRKQSYKPRKQSIQVLMASDRSKSRGTLGSPMPGTPGDRIPGRESSATRGMSFYKASTQDKKMFGSQEHIKILLEELKYASDTIHDLKPMEIKIKTAVGLVIDGKSKSKKKALEAGLDWHMANEIIGELSTLAVSMHSDLDALETFKEDVRHEITDMIAKIDELEHEKENARLDANEYQMRAKELEQEVATLEQLLGDARTRTESRAEDTSAIDRMKKQLKTTEKDLAHTKTERDALRAELDKITHEFEFISKDYQYANDELQGKEGEIEHLSSKVEHLTDQLDKMKTEFKSEVREQLHTSDVEKKQLKRRVAELEGEVEDLQGALQETTRAGMMDEDAAVAMMVASPTGGQSYMDGMGGDGEDGAAEAFSLDVTQMGYEYSDDDWLDDGDEDGDVMDYMTFESETAAVSVEVEEPPDPEASFSLESAKLEVSVDVYAPEDHFVSQKSGVLYLAPAGDPYTPLPDMDAWEFFEVKGPVLGLPHLLCYFGDMHVKHPEPLPEPEVEPEPVPEPEPEPEPKPRRSRRVIEPEKEKPRESVTLRTGILTKEWKPTKRDFGPSTIVTKSSRFADILGKFKKDEIEKPGMPGSIVTASQHEKSIEYDKKRGKMSKISRSSARSVVKSAIAKDGTVVEEHIVSRQVHKLKPRWAGYLTIRKSSIVPDVVLKRRSKYFFVLDGLPQNTNVKQREADHLKDREGEPLVPSLFFFESEEKFRKMMSAVGGFNTRSILFQKTFALYCVGILQLHCRGFSDKWAKCYRGAREVVEDLSVDSKMEALALECAKECPDVVMFCIGKDEVTILQADKPEMSEKWTTKIGKLMARRSARKDTIVEEGLD